MNPRKVQRDRMRDGRKAVKKTLIKGEHLWKGTDPTDRDAQRRVKKEKED